MLRHPMTIKNRPTLNIEPCKAQDTHDGVNEERLPFNYQQAFTNYQAFDIISCWIQIMNSEILTFPDPVNIHARARL